MARNTSYYFSHDYNSRSDQKIKKILVKYGMLGYGVFWSIIEELYNNANAMRTDYESIAYELRIDESVVKSIINDFDLFVFDGDYFGSSSVERRLNERTDKSKKASESANKRWEKMRTECERNANASKNDAIKESKGNKESKEKEINDYEFEILEEYTFYEFWELYDKKQSKEKCQSKYSKLSLNEKEKIFETLPNYILSTPDKKFRKNPETYLNNKSWNDEIIISEFKPFSKMDNLRDAYNDNSLKEKYLKEEANDIN